MENTLKIFSHILNKWPFNILPNYIWYDVCRSPLVGAWPYLCDPKRCKSLKVGKQHLQ